VNHPAGRGSFGLRLIGAFKFASGLLLVALGVGLFRGSHDDLGEEAEHLVAVLKLDPGNHYIHSAIEKVSGIKPKQLKAIGVGTFLYSLIYLAEGGGLLLGRRWAEYFTVFATGLFIPLELYEVARKFTPIKLTVLVINVACVVYVVYQLRRRLREDAGPSTGPASEHSG
jgi:uncharacterized membrane protein (DUF2068 family)